MGVHEVLCRLRQHGCERLNDPCELGFDLRTIRPADDRAHQGCDSRAAPDVATVAKRSRSSCARHCCWGTSGNVSAIASTRPRWASHDHEQVTSTDVVY